MSVLMEAKTKALDLLVVVLANGGAWGVTLLDVEQSLKVGSLAAAIIYSAVKTYYLIKEKRKNATNEKDTREVAEDR